MTDPRFLLDTNICIYLAERTSPTLTRRLEECQRGTLVTSAIVYAEFVRGIDWASANAEKTLSELFDDIDILPFDTAAARQYASLPFVRHRLDRLIAAIQNEKSDLAALRYHAAAAADTMLGDVDSWRLATENHNLAFPH